VQNQAFHCIVLMKQVPDTDEVKMNPETGTMVREGVGTVINPLDLHAIQAALDLREQRGGTITVVSMGPPVTREALKEAISMGVDETLLLTDRHFSGADTWATAHVLAEAIRTLPPFDLILAGEKATDGETGQVGPEVAAMLDLPFSTYITRIEVDSEGVEVERTVEEGYEMQYIPFPCLLTVLGDLNDPGMPTLSGKIKARRTEIKGWNAESMNLDPSKIGLQGSPTRVVSISYPKITRSVVKYTGKEIDQGIQAIVRRLKEMALLPFGR